MQSRFRVFFFFPAHLQQTKLSEAAQLKLIASGKVQLEARSRASLKRLLEAEQELDDEVVHLFRSRRCF
jgi:hypothetical protein